MLFLTDLQEFAITPDYQLQGLGKKLMLHIIELAKRGRLNIAITADAGAYFSICRSKPFS